MAPIIKTSKALAKNFIYVPSMKLYIAKERTYYDENWFQIHEALENEDSRMLTPSEFVNFLNYLRENLSEENNKIFNDITEKRSPWRAEWLDAYFEKRKRGLYILTGNRKKAEKLEKAKLRDKTSISLKDWLKSHTSQGLPRLDVFEEDIAYWYPKETGVVRFVADFDRVLLDCDGNSFASDPGLGVRAVKQL